MRIYTVHDRPGSLQPDRGAVAVKEGFNWPAFLFTFVWALWHRAWYAALGLAVAALAMEAVLVAAGADDFTQAAAALAYSVLVGFGANDWRRAALARRGYRAAGVIAAPDEDTALLRFFDLAPGPVPL